IKPSQNTLKSLKITQKKSGEVGTALLYIRRWGGPRTRDAFAKGMLFEAKLMENLVLNFLTLSSKRTRRFCASSCTFLLSKPVFLWQGDVWGCAEKPILVGLRRVLSLDRIFEEKFMENHVPNFQNLVIKEKIFTIFQPQNYLQIFAILTYFKSCIKFSRFSGQPKNFYRCLKKKYLEKLKISIFLNYNHIKKSIRSKTGFSYKFPITYEALSIKFSSISTRPKKFYRHFKEFFSEKSKISMVYKQLKKKYIR
ncbi:hypothetical protein AGLY_009818, partial [Aphis glycines]